MESLGSRAPRGPALSDRPSVAALAVSRRGICRRLRRLYLRGGPRIHRCDELLFQRAALSEGYVPDPARRASERFVSSGFLLGAEDGTTLGDLPAGLPAALALGLSRTHAAGRWAPPIAAGLVVARSRSRRRLFDDVGVARSQRRCR